MICTRAVYMLKQNMIYKTSKDSLMNNLQNYVPYIPFNHCAAIRGWVSGGFPVAPHCENPSLCCAFLYTGLCPGRQCIAMFRMLFETEALRVLCVLIILLWTPVNLAGKLVTPAPCFTSPRAYLILSALTSDRRQRVLELLDFRSDKNIFRSRK